MSKNTDVKPSKSLPGGVLRASISRITKDMGRVIKNKSKHITQTDQDPKMLLLSMIGGEKWYYNIQKHGKFRFAALSKT